MKAAGIVVLFNPNHEVKANIATYIDEVDVVYCIDNSDKVNSIYKDIKNVVYLPQMENLGLAKALNLGCKLAIQDGADTLVTLDQDTVCERGTIKKLISLVNEAPDGNILAAPNIKHIFRDKNNDRIFSNESIYPVENREQSWVITSGSVFSSSLYNKTEGFDEKLFIAQIDQDFCCQIKQLGGKIMIYGELFIKQEAGNTTKRRIFHRNVHVPNYSHKRYYYIFRNEIYLRRKWRGEYQSFSVILEKYIVLILLFEKNKMQKLYECMRGIMDGRRM